MTELFGRFDFGLSEAEEARAARLHADSIIIDTLFQGPVGHRAFTDDMVKELQADPANDDPVDAWVNAVALVNQRARAGELEGYEEIWRQTGLTATAFGIEVGTAEEVLAAAVDLATRVEPSQWLFKALTAADIRRAKAEQRHAVFVNCQPTTPVSRDLGLLDQAIDLGLRMLQLTYNYQDHIGAGCTERVDGGLSRFGVKVVEHLNERGVLVDVSHCGPQTTLDACAFSSAPVVASHTGAQGVYDHARGKSDEALDALAATGGVVCVCAVPFFLAPGRPTVEVVLDHVDYIARRIGPDKVGIGTDWPVPLPAYLADRVGEDPERFHFRPEDNIGGFNLVGFDDYRDMPNITRGLVSRGYSDEEIRGILGENFLRVFETVCG
ncbi:MAG TPA: membrane dipeptidase [Acidimicrobiales bacterium]|nr:membrane dipeptidase [Acidimicrobiales bacterium]